MRKHFIALESNDFRGECVSLEEEAVMLDEAAGASAEAESDLKEADRIVEVSDALEDLAVIADGIEEASPTEIALIENAGDMAVAGTDVSPEEIVPAMESFKGKKIATETIRETARNIWESILRFLKQVWAKIEAFYHNMFGTIPNLRRAIVALEKRIDDTIGKKNEETKVKINTGIAALSVNGVPAKTAGELKSGLKDLQTAAEYTYGGYMDSISSLGDVIAKSISEFDPAKAEECAANMLTKLKSHSPPKIPGGSAADKSRFPGFLTQVGTPLFGNQSIIIKAYTDTTDSSVLGSLDRYRQTRVVLGQTSEKSATVVNDFELTVMSAAEMKGLLKDMESLLKVLAEFERGSKRKAVKATQKKIEDASAKATSEMEKADKGDEGARASVPYYRKMLDFNGSYAHWVKDPAVPMLSLGFTSIKAVMAAIQKSCAAYK